MSLDLPGTSGSYTALAVNNAMAQNRAAISASFWFMPRSQNNANIIGDSTTNGGTPTSNTRWAIKNETAAGSAMQVQLRAPDSGARTDTNSTAGAFVNGQLMNGVAASDVSGDTSAFYKNGAPFGGGPAVVANAATDNASSASGAVGAEEDGSSFWNNGIVSDITVYGRVLTAAEAETIYYCKGGVVPYNALLDRWQWSGLAQGAAASGVVMSDSGALQIPQNGVGGVSGASSPIKYRAFKGG